MKKHLLLFAASLMLVGAGCLAEAPPSEDLTVPPPKPTSVTFHDAARGFSVQHPRNLTIITDKAQMETSGYIPACDPSTAVACFLIPQTAYPGTNFGSAGLAVNILPGVKTEKACLAATGNMRAGTKSTINGQSFMTFSDGDAAMSHRSDGLDALTFRDGTCWNLTTRTNTTVFEVYAPGTIKEFSAADQQAVDRILTQMLQSFRFSK